jgi:hypothetical protein
MADARKDGIVPIEPERRVATGPGHTEASSFDPRRLDFGHHIGRSIEELAQADPEYLAWLERHPAGARYRAEIHRVMNGSGARRY